MADHYEIQRREEIKNLGCGNTWWETFLFFTCSRKLWGPIVVVALVVLATKVDVILHNLYPLSH